MAVTLGEICNGIETALSTAEGLRSSTSYDEVTEGIPAMDCPRLQVYPEGGTCDRTGSTDRTTMQAGVQQSEVTIFADLFARQRSQLREDMEAAVNMIDSLIDVLQSQERPPFFNVRGIKNFKWSWKRAVFRYGGEKYMGARFTLYIRVF